MLQLTNGLDMRKDIMIAVSLCILCITGCKNEDVFVSNGEMINGITVTGGSFTRASMDVASGETEIGFGTIVTENGDTLYITASLSDMVDEHTLPSESVETKGKPISDSNLGAVYSTVGTTVYKEDGSIYSSTDKNGTATAMGGLVIAYNDGSWAFDASYYWPMDGSDLYFCSYSPVEKFTAVSNGIPSELSWNSSDKKLTFNYTMPAVSADEKDAIRQPDMLLGINCQNKATYDGSANIGLRHTLTAVRFILGDIKGNLKIGKVSLDSLYSTGTATFDSSNADSPISWSNWSSKKTYCQTFNTEDQIKDAPLDSDESTTFMVIPQPLCDDAGMSIYIGGLHPEVIKFKNLNLTDENGNSLCDWSNYAGKMLTFRISSTKDIVSVKVTDTCTGNVKSNIAITNDGNADIFVRAELVGNWINSNGQILASWREDDSYGTFVSSKGSNANLSEILDDNWQKAADGFYYYRYIIGSGQVLKHNMFNTFTLSGKPHDSDGKWEGNVDMQIDALELTILVQAVRADSGKASAIAAWGSGNVGFLTDTADN